MKHINVCRTWFLFLIAVTAFSVCEAHAMPLLRQRVVGGKKSTPRIGLILDPIEKDGRTSLCVWTAWPDSNTEKVYTGKHFQVFVNDLPLPCNDGTGGEPGITGNTLPDTVTVSCTFDKDTVVFRIPVPRFTLTIPEHSPKWQLRKLIKEFQTHLATNQSMSVVLMPPVEGELKGKPWFSTSLEISQKHIKCSQTIFDSFGCMSQTWVPLSLLGKGTYSLHTTMDFGDVRLAPIRTTVAPDRLPTFVYMPMATLDKTFTITK